MSANSMVVTLGGARVSFGNMEGPLQMVKSSEKNILAVIVHCKEYLSLLVRKSAPLVPTLVTHASEGEFSGIVDSLVQDNFSGYKLPDPHICIVLLGDKHNKHCFW